MSIYNIQNEPTLAAASLAEADLFLVADNSVGDTTKKVTTAVLRQAVKAALVTVTAATVTLTAAAHAGRDVVLSRAGGIAVTLPAATGTGNKYRLIVAVTFTTDGTVKVVGNDTMIGTCILFADGGDTVVGFAAASQNDTITLDGADTGGILGCTIELLDIAADLWQVVMVSDATGTEATPFSDTVS